MRFEPVRVCVDHLLPLGHGSLFDSAAVAYFPFPNSIVDDGMGPVRLVTNCQIPMFHWDDPDEVAERLLEFAAKERGFVVDGCVAPYLPDGRVGFGILGRRP